MKAFWSRSSDAWLVAAAAWLTLVLVLVPIPNAAAAALPQPRIAAVEAAVRDFMTRTGAPSVNIALVDDGRILFERGFGLADPENFLLARPETVYRLASVVKPITAVAVLQLVQEGRIDLGASIRSYVPELPEHYQPVTIRDLLRHSGGVRHFNNDAEFATLRHCDGLTQSLAIFAADPLVHPPGQKLTYSSYGYTLLGVAVERVSGLSFVDYLDRHVTRPAGMRSTRVDGRDVIPFRAEGYVRRAERMIAADPVDTSCRIPAGGLVGTAGDLARFAIALERGDLLRPETVREMMTSQVSDEMIRNTLVGLEVPEGYVFPGLGFGWAIARLDGRAAVNHGGNQQGVTSMLYLIPEERTAVAIFANLEAQGPEITALAEQLSTILITGAPRPAPAPAR